MPNKCFSLFSLVRLCRRIHSPEYQSPAEHGRELRPACPPCLSAPTPVMSTCERVTQISVDKRRVLRCRSCTVCRSIRNRSIYICIYILNGTGNIIKHTCARSWVWVSACNMRSIQGRIRKRPLYLCGRFIAYQHDRSRDFTYRVIGVGASLPELLLELALLLSMVQSSSMCYSTVPSLSS